MPLLRPVQPRTVRFAEDLSTRGDALAVHGPGASVSYAALDQRVDAAARDLGAGRRLVLLASENSLDFVTAYLGALRAGHVVLLAPGDRMHHLDGLIARYDPDVVAGRGDEGWQVATRHEEPVHDLHPELALLLKTSGSTGAAKLVRLSHENLDSNARSIAEALSLREDDCAITSLPLHYCYGLSVLHSHLAVGASIALTDLSVVDPCFWERFDAVGATTLAGVPHTFDLLDRSGFGGRSHPTLRRVTQAGGRLSPERVQSVAALGRERGFDLYVMYGQTEATARMAVLSPDLAAVRPSSVGRPIPGGEVRIEPLSEVECGLGELVYRGPNVMLGYAEHPEDLARGRDLHELWTGDLARLGDDGLIEIVGRRSRFAKIVGLRIDLDEVERDLAVAGQAAHCVDLGDALGVVVEAESSGPAVTDLVSRRHGIPAGSVVVLDGHEPPRLPTGKPDYVGMAELVGAYRESLANRDVAPVDPDDDLTDQVVALYGALLSAPATADTSFVALGGDSLSYVEVSLRLEQLLGELPAGWHLATPRDLAARVSLASAAPRRGQKLQCVETSVVVRATAVLLILANHTHLSTVPGGAHTLLAMVGFNLARFQLTDRPRRDRVRGIVRSVTRVVLPSAAWIGAVAVVVGTYDWRNVLMLNQFLGDWSRWSSHWHYWFIEAITSLLLGTALLMSLPLADRWERRWPLAFPLALVGVGLVTRYHLLVPDAGQIRGANASVLLWLFATGWAAARAATTRQRLLVSAIPVLTVPGFWPSMPGREATIIVGLLALIWFPTTRLPRWAARGASQIATASLFVYLTHFVVYPRLMGISSVLAMAASLAVGIAYCRLWGAVEGWTRRSLSALATTRAAQRGIRVDPASGQPAGPGGASARTPRAAA